MIEFATGTVTVAVCTALIVTMLLIVAVFVEALAPVVIVEVSFTVAAIVNVPAAAGCQFTTKGEEPVAVPTNVPFAETVTDEMLEPAVGAAFTEMFSPVGEVASATGEPVAGNWPGVKLIVGVA